MANDYTTCKTCNRSVMSSDVDEWGNCVFCKSASAAPTNKATEKEWADLGRTRDKDEKEPVK
jgi:hypothetical protein